MTLPYSSTNRQMLRTGVDIIELSAFSGLSPDTARPRKREKVSGSGLYRGRIVLLCRAYRILGRPFCSQRGHAKALGTGLGGMAFAGPT